MFGIWYIVIFLVIISIILGIIAFYNKSDPLAFLCVLLVAMILLFTIVAIYVPKTAEEEFDEYVKESFIIKYSIENSDYSIYKNEEDLINRIAQLNSWLYEAKTNKDKNKSMSKYYKLDLDSLDYIKMPNN